jgi:hypothetical protein
VTEDWRKCLSRAARHMLSAIRADADREPTSVTLDYLDAATHEINLAAAILIDEEVNIGGPQVEGGSSQGGEAPGNGSEK